MGAAGLLIMALGLAADAFSVSVCKGLAVNKKTLRTGLLCGVWFGLFQAAMPLAGYLLGSTFAKYIEKFDHWIAFAILALIGINMIRESVGGGDENEQNDATDPKSMLLLAVATSIDALAVGVSFAFIGVRIPEAVFVIGAVTFVLSLLGVLLGSLIGRRFRMGTQIAGGVILILLGLRILLTDLLQHT